MSKWVGYAVSVNCGEPLGCYQGTILEADGNTITLTKAFRNGFPYPKSQVTLNAADIKELKIIEARTEPSEQTHSTVAVSKNNKKCHRATVCENLQANPTSSGNQSNVNPGNSSKGTSGRGPGPGPGPARSKPIDIQPGRPTVKSNTHTTGVQTGAGSYGGGAAGSTPKSRGGGGGGGGYDKARRRNEACFGEAAEAAIDDDFDFEGNLALFDKRALWEHMRHAHKPDLLRQADDSSAKMRHDENVLGGGGSVVVAARRGIVVPEELRGPLEYVSDDGACVPSVVPALRRQLYDQLDRLGLGECTRTLLARAACDVALRLVGGARRLEPRNAHQAPRAVALLGPHEGGAVGARCLRLLMAHGARGALHVGGGALHAGGGALARELAALALDEVRPAPLDRLPTPDVLLLAAYDVRTDDPQDQYEAMLRWARGARAAVVAVEPPGGGWGAWGVACRASVAGALPPALDASLGRLYLCALAPPARTLRDLRVTYRPPFGANAVLALHPVDPADRID